MRLRRREKILTTSEVYRSVGDWSTPPPIFWWLLTVVRRKSLDRDQNHIQIA